MRTFRCEDCGAEAETKRANTKRCPACRLYRDLLFVQERTAKCYVCESTYCPVRRRDPVCHACDPYHPHKGDCVLCGKTNQPLVEKGLSVCKACGHDKEKRPLLTRAVAKKRRTNLEVNSHETV